MFFIKTIAKSLFFSTIVTYARVAQLVERSPEEGDVGSSSLPPSTK